MNIFLIDLVNFRKLNTNNFNLSETSETILLTLFKILMLAIFYDISSDFIIMWNKNRGLESSDRIANSRRIDRSAARIKTGGKREQEKREGLGEERWNAGWNREREINTSGLHNRTASVDDDCAAKAIQWRCTNKARYVPWMRPEAIAKTHLTRYASPRGAPSSARQKNKAI